MKVLDTLYNMPRNHIFINGPCHTPCLNEAAFPRLVSSCLTVYSVVGAREKGLEALERISRHCLQGKPSAAMKLEILKY